MTGLPVSTGSGGLTKFNRTRLQLPKSHWLDAAPGGKVEELKVLTFQRLLIKATGHGTRQMCGTNKFGFPIRHKSRKQIHFGFISWRYYQCDSHRRQKSRILCRTNPLPCIRFVRYRHNEGKSSRN
jgi:hypothetical protein